MRSLNKFCLKLVCESFDACFVNEIVDLIDNHFGNAVLEENKFILNSLLSRMYNPDAKIFSACFIKLTNLGGIVDDNYNFVIRNVSTDAFFNYIAKNNIKTDDNLISCAMTHELDNRMSDWIFDQWESRELVIDLDSLCQIVSDTLYGNKKTYLDRIVQKIFDHVDMDIIVISAIANCQYVDDTNEIIIYASESINYDKIRLLKIIKHFRFDKENHRLRNKSANLFATEKEKLGKLIKKDETAHLIYQQIIDIFDCFYVENYATIMDALGLFINIYYAL